MNVLTVKNRIRRIFGDESGTFLEDADLFAWINEALVEIHRVNRVSKSIHPVILTTNTNIYPLPADFLAVDKVFLNNMELANINLANADWNAFSNNGIDCPPGSYAIYNNSLVLASATVSVGLVCRVVYTASPPVVTLDADLMSTTPEAYHELIIRYCLARANEMSEELTAADRYQSQFKMGLTEMRGEIKAPVESSYAAVGFWGDDY
jgi:hypothetical protein